MNTLPLEVAENVLAWTTAGRFTKEHLFIAAAMHVETRLRLARALQKVVPQKYPHDLMDTECPVVLFSGTCATCHSLTEGVCSRFAVDGFGGNSCHFFYSFQLNCKPCENHHLRGYRYERRDDGTILCHFREMSMATFTDYVDTTTILVKPV